MKKMFVSFLLASAAVNAAQASNYCFQSNGQIGSLVINEELVQFNYDIKTELMMNKMMGNTEHYSKSGNVITVETYLESRVSDGFPATIIVTKPSSIQMKSAGKVVANYKIVQCPVKK